MQSAEHVTTLLLSVIIYTCPAVHQCKLHQDKVTLARRMHKVLCRACHAKSISRVSAGFKSNTLSPSSFLQPAAKGNACHPQANGRACVCIGVQRNFVAPATGPALFIVLRSTIFFPGSNDKALSPSMLPGPAL